jgi:type II secretory pathway predicted ATPase ExeA
MLKAFYGLTKEPFKDNKIELLKQQEQIFQILQIHAWQGGFCFIFGEQGLGKSILKKHIEDLHERKDSFVIAINRTMHTYINLIKGIAQEMKLKVKGKVKEYENAILKEAQDIIRQNKKLITVIDEANHLDYETLMKLRLFFDNFPKSHNLILFSHPDMLSKLDLRMYRDVKARITYSAELKPLNEDDMLDFIKNEIKKSNIGSNIFDENALNLIVRSVDGNLRLAINLCYGCLVQAVKNENRNIHVGTVNEVLIQPHWRYHSDPSSDKSKK